jgi:hypothetical protein
VRLLFLLLTGSIAFFMLAHPNLQYTYWSGIAAVPVGLCLALALGGDECAANARRLVKERKQKAVRDRAEQTMLEWGKRYGPSVVTPVRKPEALPVSIAPSATGSPVIGGSMSSDEFAWQVARAAEESYVPEGSAELLQNLMEALRDQAAEAVKGSHWEMNAEWAAEVKKLKVIDGNREPLWKVRTRVMPAGYPSAYLLGFPVRVSDEYGAPSLEGP